MNAETMLSFQAQMHCYGFPVDGLLKPQELWTRSEVMSKPSPVPKVPGVYAWYLRGLTNVPLADANTLIPSTCSISAYHLPHRPLTEKLRVHNRLHIAFTITSPGMRRALRFV